MVKSQKSNSRLLIKIIIFLVCLAILIFLLFKFNIITGNYILPTGYLGTAYAPPYNVFESNSKVFSINPEYFGLSNELLSMGVNVSMPGGYIYKKGYVYNTNTSDWDIFDFVQTPVEGSYWIQDYASASLTINSSTMLKNGENYIVAYACKKYNNEWKCGCNSQTDVCNKWMLQAFNLSGVSNSGTTTSCINNSDCVIGNCTNGKCIVPHTISDCSLTDISLDCDFSTAALGCYCSGGVLVDPSNRWIMNVNDIGGSVIWGPDPLSPPATDTTFANSMIDGLNNTNTVWAHGNGSFLGYPAFQACNQTINGKSDWYLPAASQVTDKYALYNFLTPRGRYWSSTEVSNYPVRSYFYGPLGPGSGWKGLPFAIRCFRNG